MSQLPLFPCIFLLIGSALAADVPFVFDEATSDVAGYTSTQLEQLQASSPELAGVPSVITPSDNQVMAFPVTGGGSAEKETTEKKSSTSRIRLALEWNQIIQWFVMKRLY